MPENAIIPDGEAVPETAKETAKEKFERERLSRRQALKKFGITSAMATFALFSVDDLARMVGKAMQQRAADNKVAEQIAQEFQQAGIALATTSGPSGSSTGSSPSDPCEQCLTVEQDQLTDSETQLEGCLSGTTDSAAQQQCISDADARNAGYKAQAQQCLTFNKCIPVTSPNPPVIVNPLPAPPPQPPES